MREVRAAKLPGGFKAYHKLRNIPVPRQTCTRYAALYQDVASLGLKADVLQAAFDAGLDLIKYVSKIKVAKTEVQKMNGPQFVVFLQQKTVPRIPRSKPTTVSEFVDAGMAALAGVFDSIKTEDEKNQAYTGIAYVISGFSMRVAFQECEFTVKSPLAKDEMEELFNREN
jgi:hypothetical protein